MLALIWHFHFCDLFDLRITGSTTLGVLGGAYTSATDSQEFFRQAMRREASGLTSSSLSLSKLALIGDRDADWVLPGCRYYRYAWILLIRDSWV